MNHNKLLLVIAGILLFIGIVRPDISSVVPGQPTNNPVETVVIDAPSDVALLEKAEEITRILKKANHSTKSRECIKLSSLYADLATLIELDGEDLIIKDTNTIRTANSLAGTMLRLDIKDKYPDLAEANKNLLISAIGDDEIVLNTELREKAASAFRALSWAFYEGSK